MKIITGSGRSGTSFVAQIINKIAGIEGDVKWDKESRAGMETKEIVDMNKMLFFLNGKDAPYANLWLNQAEIGKAKYCAKSVLQKVAENYQQKWVKDPLFSKTLQLWIDCHIDVETVIICTRNVVDSAKSAKKTGKGFEPAHAYADWQIEAEMHARQGYLWDTVLRYKLPYHVVRYEHMINDLQAALIKEFPDREAEDIIEHIKKEWKPNV